MKLTEAIILRFLRQITNAQAPSTVQLYAVALRKLRLFAGSNEDVTKTTMLDFQSAMLRKNKASTINKYLGQVDRFFAWAVECDLCETSPMPNRYLLQADPPDKQPITAEDYAAILAAIKPQDGEFWPLAVRLGWATGLRLSDVALLKHDSLDRKENILRVQPKKTRKHGRVVEMPLAEELMQVLPAGGDGYVFPAMAAEYLSDAGSGLSRQFATLAARAGVQKTFHCFRHGFITRLLERGVNPAVVAELCGIGLQTVMTYCHTSMETKRKALELA